VKTVAEAFYSLSINELLRRSGMPFTRVREPAPQDASDTTAFESPTPVLREGVKYDGQKLRYDLIPVYPMERVAEVYTYGAAKYGERNWEAGMDYHRLYGAAQRHLKDFWNREDIDSESKCHHLSSVVFCCLALMQLQRTHPDRDDRPPRIG
jgi:hypothetical protein